MRQLLPVGYSPNNITVNWTITYGCNYDCSYCPSHAKDWKDFSYENTVEAFLFLYEEVIKRYNKKTLLWFTGGEPTELEWFLEFLAYVNSVDSNITIGVTTNGSRTLEYYKNMHALIDRATYSLHFDWANYKSFMKKTYELHKLYKNRVHIAVMYEKPHSDLAEKTCQFFSKSGIQYQLLSVRNIKDSTDDYYRYTNSQVAYIRDNTSVLNDILIDEVPTSSQKILNEQDLDKVGFKDWTCWAGVDYLYITQNYDVISSWCRIREQGNLLEKRLHYDNQPVLCDGRLCACNTDVMTRKEFYDV